MLKSADEIVGYSLRIALDPELPMKLGEPTHANLPHPTRRSDGVVLGSATRTRRLRNLERSRPSERELLLGRAGALGRVLGGLGLCSFDAYGSRIVLAFWLFFDSAMVSILLPT